MSDALLYVADPLCSWCYGFGPELTRLLAGRPGMRLELLMGGLRPYNTEPMSSAFRDMLRGHWVHVATASGLPFSGAIFENPDFIYDTEPPCRAVVTAREMDPSRAFELMKAIQSAFYRDGHDVTQPAELADLAQGCGYDREAFLTLLESDAMIERTRNDFATAQQLGVSGFPTLAVEHEGQLYLVSSGYAQADVLEQRLDAIAQRLAPEK